jgi:Family of unknown function (DUF5906)
MEDHIKAMITRTKVRIEGKFVNAYEIDDVMNWIFLSNNFDALHLEDRDRRWFIRSQPMTDASVLDKAPGWEGFADEFVAWVDDGGAAEIMHHLMREVDCSNFQPAKSPPMTDDKEAMIINSRSEEIPGHMT